MKHIDDFWGNYNIKFAYKIEHKPEHLAIRTGYMGKANYALKTYNKEEIPNTIGLTLSLR